MLKHIGMAIMFVGIGILENLISLLSYPSKTIR